MIKRIRYVIVRTKDEAVFCGLARHYQFKTLEELGDTEIKTYMSEAKAKASFLSSWWDSKNEDFENGRYKVVKVFQIIEADDDDKSVHVGDEIYSELTNCKAVVHRIDAWNRYQCFNDEGSQFIISTETFNDYWVKTGRSYPQIVEVLKQMKEWSEE